MQPLSSIWKPRNRVTPDVYKLHDLDLNPNRLPKRLLDICTKLQEAGFQAYLVGGGIRDLLLGVVPKDFDVVTDALPDQIVKVFPRSRRIGRRFPIVHVGPARDPVEVTTFRKTPSRKLLWLKNLSKKRGKVEVDVNYASSVDQDYIRRDFTINALYCDPVAGTVLDFVGGMGDLKARRLVMIGEVNQRFLEDPMRILRAVRLSSKLALQLDTDLEQALMRHSEHLSHVNASRMATEMSKCCLTGHGFECWCSLEHYGLLPYLIEDSAILAEDAFYPAISDFGTQQVSVREFWHSALKTMDGRHKRGMKVSEVVLYSVLLWPAFLGQLAQLAPWILSDQSAQRSRQRKLSREVVEAAAYNALKQQHQRATLTRVQREIITDVWSLQHRLLIAQVGNIRMVKHPWLKLALAFAELRRDAGDKVKIDTRAWREERDQWERDNPDQVRRRRHVKRRPPPRRGRNG